MEDWSCSFFYANEKITLLEICKLVATTEDLTKHKNLISRTNVIDSCTREQANTKWKFYKLKNLTIFAALLEEVHMGRKHTLLPDPLLKNHSFKCLSFEESIRKPYNDNLSLIRALALHLHGNERLEERTPKLFNL